MSNKKSVNWSVLAILFLTVFALLVAHGDRLAQLLSHGTWAGDCVKVHFLDVGQGASTLIQSGKDGILIDAGEREFADRVISYIRRSGVRKLSVVVATHPHSDHIGALPEVIRTFPVGALLIPRLTKENMPASYSYQALLETVKQEQIPLITAKPGTEYTLENTAVQILAPLAQSNNLNDMSVACRVTAFSTVFLLPADLETAGQNSLLQSGEQLRCDVLQVPHHGSAGAFYPAFLDAAAPQAAVISCGLNNDYGHPHQEVLQYLQQKQTVCYRTDLQADVVVFCYAEGYRIDFDREKDY